MTRFSFVQDCQRKKAEKMGEPHPRGSPLSKFAFNPQLQAQEFRSLMNQPGWVPRKRFPGYDQQLSLPWMQPRGSISGYP
jgi:hypothetical protein